MSAAGRARVALGVAGALLCAAVLLPPAEAKRKKSRQKRRGEAPTEVQPQPAPCQESACQPGLRLLIEEEGPPPRPLGAFRYLLRIGDQRLEAGCPRGKDDAGAPGRCVPGGVEIPFTPEHVDVTVEAAGFRPLLLTVTPSYPGRCCPRAEVRLVLRREGREE